MKSLKRVLCSAAFLGSASLLLAQGTPVQRTTQLNISEPTEISGTILQPGVYMLRVHDFTNGKVQVQVTDENNKKVFATVTAMRLRRNLDTNQQQAEQTEFTFTTANGHPALSTWFYPGDEWGEEFTSGKATWIAEARAETTTQAQTETRATEAPAPAAETHQPAPAPAEAAAPTPAARPTALPKTGSSLPLFGLIGLGAFGAAAALHVARRMA
ncbi:MAG TPA: LPXTG cell wall anchor domain-containing protein [Thermoanaerobaculia bacterium]|jgi:LPXTG-motif cell wall-anchored protein|nr:LPXTG cell wall anchor domain-containing protein [Thermoanaerobaculia bacterium]